MFMNLFLLVAIGCFGKLLQERIQTAAQHEHAVLAFKVPPADVPQPAPLGKVAALDATSYQDAVSKNLFSRDRNPNPILDPPPPPPAPPPIPAFPVARGVMIWGNLPPTVVLSTAKGANDQRGYHPGDKIGEWKILTVDNQFIDLEWNGQVFHKRLDELMDRTPIQFAVAEQAAPAAAAPATKSLVESRNGQGADMGGGFKACAPGDKQPAGTVVDGAKKIVSRTPFGEVCRWEPVGQ